MTADEACQALSPEGHAAGGTVDPQLQAKALAYAACIRSHGVPSYPDPVFVGGSIRETVRAGSGVGSQLATVHRSTERVPVASAFRARWPGLGGERRGRWRSRLDRKQRPVKATAGGIGFAVVASVGLGLSLTSADGEAAPPAATSPAVASAPAAPSASPSPSPSPSTLPAPSTSAMPFVASSGVAVQLNFSSPGVLTAVLVKVGDHVTKGQALASVDSTAAQIAVTSAQANVDKAKTALTALTQGLSPQELAQLNLGEAQAAAAVTNAQQAVTDAQAQADQDAATQNSLLTAAQQSLVDSEAQANQDATDSAQQVTAAQAQLASDEGQTHPDPVKIAADNAALVSCAE